MVARENLPMVGGGGPPRGLLSPSPRVFIANFGRENYEWPECRARGTIATMNGVTAQKLWEAGDREAYIEQRMKGKTVAGITPTRPVASRWFNLMTIVSASSGDIWIHRDKDDLWWTISNSEAPEFVQKTEPIGDKRSVVVCHKPCRPWSNKTRAGARLSWAGLHAKARDFLSTEATLQQLNPDNALYAETLIGDGDLTPWHSRPVWKARAGKAGKSQVTHLDAKRRAAYRMAETALATAVKANGQQVSNITKNKEFGFKNLNELENYVIALTDSQEGLCALTNIPLQYDGEHEDIELLASLDRIDSDGHYTEGNLQVVCRFVNRWKRNDEDQSFRRLLEIVRHVVL